MHTLTENATDAFEAYHDAPFYAIVCPDGWAMYAKVGVDPSAIESIAKTNNSSPDQLRACPHYSHVVVALAPRPASNALWTISAAATGVCNGTWDGYHEVWGAIHGTAVAAYDPANDLFVDPAEVIPTKRVTIAELRAGMSTNGLGQFVTDDDLRNLVHRFPMPVEVID